MTDFHNEIDNLTLAITNNMKEHKEALLKIRDQSVIPICSKCANGNRKGDIMVVNNKQIYGKSYGKWAWAYVCTSCGNYVGMHNYTGIPLGNLADKKTREARKLVKTSFNKLWLMGGEDRTCSLLTRSMAYSHLACKMKIKKEACHFGLFDYQQCMTAKKSIEILSEKWGNK